MYIVTCVSVKTNEVEILSVLADYDKCVNFLHKYLTNMKTNKDQVIHYLSDGFVNEYERVHGLFFSDKHLLKVYKINDYSLDKSLDKQTKKKQ